MKKLLDKISIYCLILCMLLLVAMPAFAEESYADPTISVEKVTAQPGDTVEVAITMHNNPGIVSAAVYIDYDPKGLELKKVKNCKLMDVTMEEDPELDDDVITELTCSQKRDEIPYYIWISVEDLPYDSKRNGDMVILTFAVKEDAEAKEYPIRIVEDNEEYLYQIYNFGLDDVSFNFVNGSVTVGVAACTHAGKTAVPAVAPECEKPGNNLYYTCADCGKVLKADGITADGVFADLTNATIDAFGNGESYKLLRMGAVITNAPGVGLGDMKLDDVDGKKTLDINAERLYDLEADYAQFAVRITNIPLDQDATVIYARAYYVFEYEGREVIVYDDIQAANYIDKYDSNDGVLEW